VRAVHDHDLQQHVHTRGHRSRIAIDHGHDRGAHHRGHVSDELARVLGISKYPHEQHVHAERWILLYGDNHDTQLRRPINPKINCRTFSTLPASRLCLHIRVPRARSLPGVYVPAAPRVLLDTAFCSTVLPHFLLVKGGQESTGSRLKLARKHDGLPRADETCAGDCC
jgi:hypothetical protein